MLGEGGRVSALASVPVGSGTATDRWMVSDPPGPAERTACATGVRSALVEAPDGVAETGIVTGGTATTLPWLLGREASGELDGGDVAMCRHRLARHPSPVIAARHRIDPVRARVLAGGVEIVAAVMERYAMTRLIVSRAGVRDGMILAYVEKGDAWVEG